MADGRFRLVLVLDEAPEELVRLVGYLEAAADKLLIDLVTVAAYEIGGSQVIVPQRVDAEREAQPAAAPVSRPAAQGRFVEGAGDFEEAIGEAPGDQQALLRRLLAWARDLEREALVRLGTYHGKSGVVTLLPRIPADDVGIVTVYTAPGAGGAYVQF